MVVVAARHGSGEPGHAANVRDESGGGKEAEAEAEAPLSADTANVARVCVYVCVCVLRTSVHVCACALVYVPASPRSRVRSWWGVAASHAEGGGGRRQTGMDAAAVRVCSRQSPGTMAQRGADKPHAHDRARYAIVYADHLVPRFDFFSLALARSRVRIVARGGHVDVRVTPWPPRPPPSAPLSAPLASHPHHHHCCCCIGVITATVIATSPLREAEQ